jgi:hypothetical protein
VLTLKQYFRHMPDDAEKPDLFMNPIPNPATTVWYNRMHKVSEARCSDLLKSMARIVGIDAECFSNKSGRATLITWMAFLGVPNEVDRLVTGHHTTDGYQRYDRSLELQQQAATTVGSNPCLSFSEALSIVSKKFHEEQYTGKSENMEPLVDPGQAKQLVLAPKPQVSILSGLFSLWFLLHCRSCIY